MNGPKCESDSRGGIKFGDEGGARLTFDDIISAAKIPHGKKSFDRFHCRLSLPKKISQVASLNRNFTIKFGVDETHLNDPIVPNGKANGAVWTVYNLNYLDILFITNQAGGK